MTEDDTAKFVGADRSEKETNHAQLKENKHLMENKILGKSKKKGCTWEDMCDLLLE